MSDMVGKSRVPGADLGEPAEGPPDVQQDGTGDGITPGSPEGGDTPNRNVRRLNRAAPLFRRRGGA